MHDSFRNRRIDRCGSIFIYNELIKVLGETNCNNFRIYLPQEVNYRAQVQTIYFHDAEA